MALAITALVGCGGEGRSLQSLWPPVGSVLGDETVVVSGSGLATPLRILFGGSDGLAIQPEGSQTLRLRTPAMAVRGEVAVSALWPDGQVLTLPQTFTYHALQLAGRVRPLVTSQVLAISSIAAAAPSSHTATDLVLLTDEAPALHRLRGQGDGRFVWHHSLPLRTAPSALLTTDVDGDGWDDVVVAEAARLTLSLWLGQSDGSLLSGGELPAGCAPASLAAADLIGDGQVDLLVGCREASNTGLFLLENRWRDGAAARFASPLPLATSGSGTVGSVSVVTADLNGDRRADIAATLSRRGGLYIWQRNLTGGLDALPVVPTGSEPTALLSTDLNGDGRGDLVCHDRGSATLSYYLSTASGPPSRASYSLASADRRVTLAALDWDGDGKGTELLLGLSSSTDGNAAATLQPLSLAAEGRLHPLTALSVANPPAQLLTTALFRGGPMALLGVTADGEALSAWPVGAATTATETQQSVALPRPHSLVTADLTSDGHSDAAWLVGSRVAVLLADSQHGEMATTELPLPSFIELSGPRGAPSALFAADLNGDWLGDLVVGDRQGLQLLLARQPALFQPPIYVDLGLPIDALSIADLNDDDRPDVIAASATASALWVLLGNGNGTLQAPRRISLPSDDSDGIYGLRVVDQDGDGHRDILALAKSHLHLLRGAADGRLAMPMSLPLSARASAFVVPDLDFDGRRDVVIASAADHRLLLFRAQPDGSLAPTPSLDADVALLSLVAEDIDRDGQIDICAITADPGELRVFLGRPGGSLLPPLRVASGQPTLASMSPTLPSLFDLASLDLSGDAERDLLTLGSRAYQVWVRTPPQKP